MERFDYVSQPGSRSGALAASEQVTSFLRSVYGWMCAGLGITAAVAWMVAGSPALLTAIASNRLLFWGLIIVQLGMVFVMSARVHTLSPTVAGGLFIGYSGLTGITMAFVLLAYTGTSVASTFLVAGGMFGSVALWGTVTSKSLAGWGQFLFMGLIGVVLASVVGIFWQNDAMQFVTAFCGVIVFTGLAAYDAQRLRNMAVSLPDGRVGSYAIVGALALYLDFINLFLMLLRLLGGRRD